MGGEQLGRAERVQGGVFGLGGRALPSHHVPRPRLVDKLVSELVVLGLAGGGYGKTALAVEFADCLGIASVGVLLGSGDRRPVALVARMVSALARARLGDLAVAVRAEREDPVGAIDALATALGREREPLLVVIDDAHHLGPEASELVVRLARTLSSPHHLLIMARYLPARLEVLAREGAVLLSAEELAFTSPEVAELCRRGFSLQLPERGVEELRRATTGWPAAVVVAAERLARSDRPESELADVRGHHSPIGYLVRAQLAELDAASRVAIVQLAHLPLLSVDVGEALTGDRRLLERVAAAGVPLSARPDGWWELPGPVQELLQRFEPLQARTALAAAPVYARGGELGHALHVLIVAGEADRAAALLASLSPQEADDLGYLELQMLIDALPPGAVERHPWTLLHLARACEPAAQVRLRAGVLERTRQLASRVGDEQLLRAAEAEVGRDLARDDRPEEAEALAERLLAEAGAGELATRARLLDVLGRAAAWRRDQDSLSRAERLLQEALSLCERLGQRSWASQVVLPLAHGVFYARGQHERSLELLERALARLPARSRHRGVILSFFADILIDCGRFEEAHAAVEEGRVVGALVGDRRISAIAAQSGAVLAAQLGDRERVIREVHAAELERDDWFEHSTGVYFLADAAEALDLVGERELALEYLDRARERREQAPLRVAVAELAVLARGGDPDQAERLFVRIMEMPRLEPRERWRIVLLGAYAAFRRDDPSAGRRAADAFEQAAGLGKPFLPLVRERAVAERLVGLAAAAGSRAAAGLASSRAPVTVAVLGRFELRRAGALITLPPGKPDQLVKLLAVSGGRIPTEVAIEALWPEVAPASGRKRLRNVLNRLRSVAADIVVRDGDALSLSDAVVDAELFEQEARRLLAGIELGAARLTIARYRGALLPDERYEPWAAAPRERLERLLLALLDAAAGAAQAAGEPDEALRYIDHALELEPYEEQRHLQAARLLLEQGRRGAALAQLDRGARLFEQLGIPVSGSYCELIEAARR